MENVPHTNGFFHILVRIHGGDAATRRTKLLVAKSVFFEAVLRHVVGTTHDCLVADFEIVGRDDDAAFSEPCNLFAKVLDVHNHTVAHNVDFVFSQYAGRQKIEHKLAFVVYDGVSRVVSALIAHHHVLRLGEQIDHASLAFVAPVDTND